MHFSYSTVCTKYMLARVGLVVVLVAGLFVAGVVVALPASAQTINEDQAVNRSGDSNAGILINEVELNPKGRDAGREWVELYNPTSSDVNIGNFAIHTSFRPSTIFIPANTVIGAGQFYVVVVEDERLAVIETLTLVDSAGRTVDTTPLLLDRSDDDRTWQRMPDGFHTWQFILGTPGAPNDPATYQKNTQANPALASTEILPSTATPECLGTTLCIEGIVTRMVDTDTLYVLAGDTTYRVDLSLTKVSRSDNTYESGSTLTKHLCLGSPVLVDQDDGQAWIRKINDAINITGVIYCSSYNLNQELLDSGFVGLEYRQCFVSEFADRDWATRNGCK